MVFDLYKKRDFGSYISDTIQFFKQFWKNYFINYITLNGALLLIMSFIYFFVFKDMFSQMMANPTEEPTLFYDSNLGISITLLVIGALVGIVFTIITVAYPIAYMRLVQKTDRETFTSSEILNEIKKDIIRIIVFGLAALVTFTPLIILFFLLSALLVILIVGLPLMILGMGAAFTWVNQALFIYLNEEDTGYFEAMSAAWSTLFSNFWHIAGTSTAMIFITSTLSGVISLVPYFIGIGQMLSGGSSEPNIGAAMPWMIVFSVVNIILTYLLNNFIYVNQGLIYYSNKEEEEHIQAYSEIDAIGRNEE